MRLAASITEYGLFIVGTYSAPSPTLGTRASAISWTRTQSCISTAWKPSLPNEGELDTSVVGVCRVVGERVSGRTLRSYDGQCLEFCETRYNSVWLAFLDNVEVRMVSSKEEPMNEG